MWISVKMSQGRGDFLEVLGSILTHSLISSELYIPVKSLYGLPCHNGRSSQMPGHGLLQPRGHSAMSDMSEERHGQLLLFAGLFQTKLGKRSFALQEGRMRCALLREKPLTNRLQAEHKTTHKKSNILTNLFPPKVVSEPDPATGNYNPYPSFPYSGSLRPVYPLSAKRTIPKSIPHPDYARDGIPRSEQKLIGRHNITILNKEEQEGMRKVCRLAREVLDAAARELKPGVTTDYIDEVVHKACIERDVRGIYSHSTFPADKVLVLPLAIELYALPQVRLYLG